MDPDEMRQALEAIAARSPKGDPDARETVIRRGHRLVRNRRLARVATTAVCVAVFGTGFAWWNAPRRSAPSEVVASPTSTPEATTVTTTTTTTAIATPTSGVVVPEAGYVFVSTPVVEGGSLFALEALHDNITSTGSRVVRVDLQTQKVVRTSNQPGASALVLAGDELWVGTGSGNGGAYGGPRITRVVALNPADLSIHAQVTIPAPGAEGLAYRPGATSLWALSGSNAIRIDASTAQISATVPLELPRSTPYRSLAVSDDELHLYVGWTTAAQVDGVTEFDATSGRRLRENAHVGGGPSDVGPHVAFAGSRLWLTFTTGTEANAVALHTSDLTATGEIIDGPQWMAVAPVGEIVWVSRAISLDCVDTHGATLVSHSTAGRIDSPAAPTARAVYVTTDKGIAIVPTDTACPGS